MLIVRELLLGPLRFSELARAVGGAPTDVLTKRLRQLEQDGIVRRRELDPPAVATAYELTAVGRELEQPLLELGRWGLNFFRAAEVEGIEPANLPTSLRMILRPPADAAMQLQLRSGGHSFRLRIAGGWIDAERGEAPAPDLSLTGQPRGVIATLIGADPASVDVGFEGDPEVLEALRAMVLLPDRLRAEALNEIALQPATQA